MKTFKILIVTALFLSLSGLLYPNFGFSLNFSPVTIIRLGNIGMSAGGSLFFDNTYLTKTSIRVGFTGDYIFYNFKGSTTTVGGDYVAGVPIATTTITTPSEFVDGYSFGVLSEFLREFGGQYYSFGIGGGIGISYTVIDGSKGVNATLRIPFRITYPISKSMKVKMYIDIVPTISLPMWLINNKTYMNSSGFLSFPISVGFRF